MTRPGPGVGGRGSPQDSQAPRKGVAQAREVTKLLADWGKGVELAQSRLMELIYDELRQLATAQLRRERRDHTLQTSALVHEAYLRLSEQKHVRWRSRAHFFGIAARMMRRVLVNHAREKGCAKRGGGAVHLPLAEAAVVSEERLAECLAVDEALEALATVDPQQAKVVELRYFGGLNRQEIAETLGISLPTVARRLRVARARLYRSLKG